MVIGAIFLYIISSKDAIAGGQWYTCNVLKVGPGGAHSYIKLTDLSVQGSIPVFQGRWFRLSAERAKEMLAVGITALSSSMKVQVFVDGEVEFSDITAIYLVNE